MIELGLHENCLGFELHDGDRLVTLYRAREELPRSESPKPCFAPIYTPSGGLVTEYRPADHAWHTGLYFGWVHANQANLWGGPWYLPEKGKYEMVEHSHGVQRHLDFAEKQVKDGRVSIQEKLEWLDARDEAIAREQRSYTFRKLEEPGYLWTIETRIRPTGAVLVLGASRAAKYSGLELRLGPPFADAQHRSSEGLEGHENIMGQQARWVSAAGAAGGAVVMMDHPDNPRHPTPWFTRRNLLGAGLLMGGDLEVPQGEELVLRYGFAVLDQAPSAGVVEELYAEFIS
ncbi:MAG: PmoA family protein [Candidatus Latescibacteria bacterium]|nr:PmoA family protein [Candidatus Latescibacterota bacterium]